MREAQFSEGVMRSLHAVSQHLERLETIHFLEEDVNILESSATDGSSYNESGEGSLQYSVTGADGSVTDYSLHAIKTTSPGQISLPSPAGNFSDRYRQMQETLRSQYLYQKGLLDEVILTILRESSSRSAVERADSTEVRKSLDIELAANGLNVPFVFAVTDRSGNIIYHTDGYDA